MPVMGQFCRSQANCARLQDDERNVISCELQLKEQKYGLIRSIFFWV